MFSQLVHVCVHKYEFRWPLRAVLPSHSSANMAQAAKITLNRDLD